MKYIGIDYGEKRIGVAVSDESEKMAFAFDVIENPSISLKASNKVSQYLKNLVAERGVGAIVLGLPLGFSMQETESTKKAREFGEFLKKELNIEIIFQNEVLSTAEVEKSGAAREGMVDASSAALILQSFLDNKK